MLRIGCTGDGKAETKQGMIQSTDECQQEALHSRAGGTTGGWDYIRASSLWPSRGSRTRKGKAWHGEASAGRRHSHCQKTPRPYSREKGEIAQKPGFSLVSSSILLHMNFVKTAGETWKRGFQEKAWGEAESEQALNGVATVLRCCRSWEACRGSGPHCTEPPGSWVGPAGPGCSIQPTLHKPLVVIRHAQFPNLTCSTQLHCPLKPRIGPDSRLPFTNTAVGTQKAI